MQHQIKSSLNRAVNQLPHPLFKDIDVTSIEKMSEHDEITRQDTEHRIQRMPIRRWSYAFACCMLLFISGFGIYWENIAVNSLITIDINPSFEITTNRRERVLEAKALNADAEEFIKGKKLHGLPVDDVIEMLFTELSTSRYLDGEKNTILLSVRNKNTGYSQKLEGELAQHIEKALERTAIKPNIVGQVLSDDIKMQQEAGAYHISAGKLQLVYQLKEKVQTSYSIPELAKLPLDQLLMLGNAKDNDDADDDTDDQDNDDASEAQSESNEDLQDADDTDDTDDADGTGDADGTDDTDDIDDDSDETEPPHIPASSTKKDKKKPTAIKKETIEPETDHEEPETSHEEPETDHEEPETDHVGPATDHVGPASDHDEPETSHDAPEVSHDEPETSHDAPEVSHDEPETSHDVPEVSHDEPEVSHDEPEADHDAPEADNE
ncbi:MAG: hypothetical protein RR242_09185 [Clostridium sp.]